MARAWNLVRHPAGLPVADDFALRPIPDRALAEGEVLIANRFLSVDPYMRARMAEGRNYIAGFALDAPMEGGAVGEVIESRAPAVPVGTVVQHMAGWREQAVLPARAVQMLPADAGVAPSAWLGVLGLTGMTAWIGLIEVAGAHAGETVFVSAAAGAVGSSVVQIAKARGLTVIASAGGAAKCDWVRSLGADHVIDYKAVGDGLGRALHDAAPDGIHVYFDNVGGTHLDAALSAARDHARFAVCGMIDVYNSGEAIMLRHAVRIVKARIRIQGFLFTDHAARFGAIQQELAALIEAGTLIGRETIVEGIEAMPDAFIGLFHGANVGKAVVRL